MIFFVVVRFFVTCDRFVSFSCKSVTMLCQILAENPNFVHLGLADNHFTSKKIEKLCDSVASSPNLAYLDLSANRFDDAAAPFIADMIAVSYFLTSWLIGVTASLSTQISFSSVRCLCRSSDFYMNIYLSKRKKWC